MSPAAQIAAGALLVGALVLALLVSVLLRALDRYDQKGRPEKGQKLAGRREVHR